MIHSYIPIASGGDGGSKVKITFESDFLGAAYTITSSDNTEILSGGTVPDGLSITVDVLGEGRTYTVASTASATNYSNSVTTEKYYGVYSMTLNAFTATLTVTTSAGATVNAVGDTATYSGTADSSGVATITIRLSGTYSVTATLNGETTNAASVSITTDGGSYTADCSFLKIVSWATGTDEEIVKMVAAADAGKISLSDYWTVGDTRSVSLSAMSATGVGESHVAQTVSMVLMNAGGKTLNTATGSGRTTCSFIVGLKNFLANGTTSEYGYMESSNTNANGWDGCKRRTWCNNVFYNAVPSTLRPIFKQHQNKTASAGSANPNAITTSVDYFALPSEKEVFGAVYCASSTAEASNTQFTYYATAANRFKYLGNGSGSVDYWWERSPYSGCTDSFCGVGNSGSAYYYTASATLGIAPFGVI